MKAANRTLLWAAIVAMLLPLTARPAEAQSSDRGNIDAIEIVVTDLATRRELGRVDPGGTLTLPEGAHVRIHMTAIPAGSSRRLLYPATEFTDATRTGVRITRSNEDNAAADLDIIPMRNPNRIQTIRFQVSDTWVPTRLRSGSFSIRVVPASGQAGYWSSTRARDLTRALYEGILMREPDTAANGTIRSIQRGGYEALVDAAVDLADSDESRIRVYERDGVCNQQRLLAIYKNLLGLSASQITRSRWDADLKRMNNGDIAQVVEDIVRSERFRSRHELADDLSR